MASVFFPALPVRTTTRTRSAGLSFAGLSTRGLPAGWAADDFAALHFRDGELIQAVAWRDEAQAYRVEPGTEIPLPTRIL